MESQGDLPYYTGIINGDISKYKAVKHESLVYEGRNLKNFSMSYTIIHALAFAFQPFLDCREVYVCYF